MEVLGYFGALIIGVTLGLIGGGGSILTVPILVYLMGVNPVMATAYSLFIVGSSSLVGAFKYYVKGLIHIRIGVIFGIPSIIAVYLTRKILVPAIPNEIASFGSYILTKDVAIMILFATLMIAASYSMIKGRKVGKEEGIKDRFNYGLILLEGIVVGTLTGLVGAGGGFLIIPALVVVTGLPMKMAVGTSLIIISSKSLIGFLGDVQNEEMDWNLLGIFALLSIGGIFIGSFLSTKIEGSKLKPLFGWFVLAMGIYILSKELIF